MPVTPKTIFYLTIFFCAFFLFYSRKFHPRNPLPPPRRVKVDPALKSTWDDGDDDTSNITVSAFPLFDKESKMSTVTDGG